MANTKQGNLVFIDTTANDIDTAAINIYYAILTPTSANGIVTLLTASGGTEIVRFQGSTATDSKHFDFSMKPINLSKGVHATVTNAVLTLITKPVGGAS